ncbi:MULTISPECIES: hypothetical protein [unclassified Diaminobutyricimonas]|uniref:hypothetical protein n=1 Tax=unclassified Diaminobutyricimonas TaxID=2643261 RepID=UPI0012F4A530|nr:MULTISPECIES: hypothetical protein [unclassified Diaminobutyricimonas]
MLLLITWIVVAVLATAGAVLAVLATRTRFRRLAALPIVPVGLGVLLVWFGGLAPSPVPVLPGLIDLAYALIGVVAGGPIAALVLRLATGSTPGSHGGIMVLREHNPQEVLRGGATIGFLERLGLVAAIAVGYPEALAVIVAIKGVGRYSELREPEVRERFIIGTLASLTWAAICGTLVFVGL